MLRRTDFTHIKYSQGGFFKRHRDYLSTTSNFVEEFTLLLCVAPSDVIDVIVNSSGESVQGGETTIFGYGKSTSYGTTILGTALLFRKDLEHEGAELKRGEKHIITLNIWATRKHVCNQSPSGNISAPRCNRSRRSRE